MDKIIRADLITLGGAPDATHACFHGDGTLYFCAVLTNLDDDIEDAFWRSEGKTMKRVDG
uniref:Uncharacterized protein n=1 Tax=viral metagenome TaxID=1070528 RepID=A0A6M3KGI1_9ZZZZ